MAIGIVDVVERLVSTLESQTTSGTSGTSQMFPQIRNAYFPLVKTIELELNLSGTSGTSGAPQPLPHTLASFVWYQPIASQTPGSQSYTYPILRPISSGCIIEAFVEVGYPAIGGDTFFEFYKNSTKIGEVNLPEGVYNVLIPITGSLSTREFQRDDFFAYRITESTTQRAKGLTVYLRFFQYPYIMADHQSPLPTP